MADIPTTTDRASTVAKQRGRFYSHLWPMAREARMVAMGRGELSSADCLAWSSCRPQVVPLVGHVSADVVMRTPEWLDG